MFVLTVVNIYGLSTFLLNVCWIMYVFDFHLMFNKSCQKL